MNIWARHWQLLVLFWLCVLLLNIQPVKAQAVNPAEAIKQMETFIKPSIQNATDWGLKVSTSLVGIQAFYALVVRLIKLGD
jgi:hypothetical protein